MSISADLTITVSTDAIDALIERVGRLNAVVEKYASLIADEARRLVPVRTGALKASIATTLDGLTAEIAAGDGLEYAAFVEYGTSRMAAQPYIRPALERYATAFIEEVQSVLNGA